MSKGFLSAMRRVGGQWAAICTLAAVCGLTTAAQGEVEQASKDVAVWSAERAAEVHAQRELDDVRARSASDPRGRGAVESDFVSRRTGLGSTPQPAEPKLLERERVESEVEALELKIRLLSREQSIASVVRTLQDTRSVSGNTRMRLLAEDASSPAGGYVYVLVEGAPTQFVWIDPEGHIDLPLPEGASFGLLVLPFGPFGAQFVGEVTAAAEGSIGIRNSRRVPLDIAVDDGSTYSGGYEVQLEVDTVSGTFGIVRSVEQDGNGGAGLWLAEGASFGFRVRLTAPFLLASAPSSVNAANSSIAVSAMRGFLLQVRLQDPDGLLQGCQFNALAESLPAVSGEGSGLSSISYSTNVDGEYRFLLGVPRGGPVSVRSSSFQGPGYCRTQEIELPVRRYLADTSVPVQVVRRPRPLIQVVGEDGIPLDWSTVVFHQVNPPGPSSYAFADSVDYSGLQAGREYEAELLMQGLYSQPVRVQAEPGGFPVQITALRLAEVVVRMHADPNDYLIGLLEAYRDGSLVMATHVGGNWPYSLRIPEGEYEFRLIGVGGERALPQGEGYVGVALKPILVSRTIAPGPQTLDIQLPTPQTGVRFDVSTVPFGLHATLHEGDQPVVALPIHSWYSGIVTDLPVIDASLRGAGFDDVRVQWQPDTSFPMVSLTAVQGAFGRLRGRLLDASGAPLAFRYITQSNDAVDNSATYWTDAEGRFDLPKQRGARFWFSSPIAGDSVSELVEVDDPAKDSTGDVVLKRAAMHAIDPAAAGPQLLYGTGDRAFRVVFLAEGYSAQQESYTDLNGNGLWDGWLFLDENGDGLWQQNERLAMFGNVSTSPVAGTDITLGNEPFVDLNGDGYPSINDRAVFELNARHYLRALLGTREIREGIEFDAYVVFVDSNQAGMDIEGADGALVLERDTAFGARFEYNRGLLSVDYGRVLEVLRENFDRWNLQVVMINQPFRMGRANSFILANGGIGATDPNDLVAGHEFGHNPGGLEDEYIEFSSAFLGSTPRGSKNVTGEVDVLRTPWVDLIDDRLDVPMALPYSFGTGLYAGAYYRAGGAYRSTMNSRMRLNSVQFNEASRKGLSASFCRAALSLSQVSTTVPATPVDRVFATGFEPTYEDYISPCP